MVCMEIVPLELTDSSALTHSLGHHTELGRTGPTLCPLLGQPAVCVCGGGVSQMENNNSIRKVDAK